MAKRMVRELRLKFYLNAYHYITIKGERGETHPHTWEFVVSFRIPDASFVPFYEFERGIAAFLEPYDGKVLNETDTFRDVLPTLEGIVETFLPEFDRILSAVGGRLLSVEGSESPTRTYVLRVLDDDGPASDEDVVDELIGEALR